MEISNASGEEIEELMEEDGIVTVAEFRCWVEDETFTDVANLYDDGMGIYLAKSANECPYCGQLRHSKDVTLP